MASILQFSFGKPDGQSGVDASESRRWRISAWGLFLLLFGFYILFSPARIDMIDGQFRFEVSRNMLDLTGPDLKDYSLIQSGIPRNAATGRSYSFYTAPASLLPLPFMMVSRIVHGARVAADRATFALTSTFAGAMIAPLLLAFYRRLGIGLKPAIGWTACLCLTTLWWPGAETVLDQCQHGVCLLGMLLLAYDARTQKRLGPALGAGLLGGLLFNYRVPFLGILPAIPIYWFLEDRAATQTDGLGPKFLLRAAALFAFGVLVGIAGYAFFNYIRFGQISTPAYYAPTPAVGNPLSGFLTLMISPGKGFLWFSPTLLISLVAMKRFLRGTGILGKTVVGITVVHVLEMSCLSFAGGDWCWGPRYLLPVMPLIALAFPYVGVAINRSMITGLVAMGALVQMMGIAVDHHRFFYYRRLEPFFWMDPWAYFRMSQLASRPAEIVESLQTLGVERPKVNSNTIGEATYCPFGPPGPPKTRADRPKLKASPSSKSSDWNRLMSQLNNRKQPVRPPSKPVDPRTWQQQFAILYLPRPWWGWINRVPLDQRPMNPAELFVASFALMAVGGGLLLTQRKSKGGPA